MKSIIKYLGEEYQMSSNLYDRELLAIGSVIETNIDGVVTPMRIDSIYQSLSKDLVLYECTVSRPLNIILIPRNE